MATKYDTNNPVGSSDPRDLFDNSIVIDEFANSSSETAVDRRGVSRKTLTGLDAEFDASQVTRENEFDASQADKAQRFNQLLAASGYVFLADYAAGIEVTEYNEVIRDGSGNLWRAASTTTLPYTTDGTGLPEGGAFVSAGDAVLRNDLMDSLTNGQGALNVRGSVIYVDTIADLQALDKSKFVDGQRVIVRESTYYYRASDDNFLLDGVAIVTPEQFGATGDGVTNDNDAFLSMSSYINNNLSVVNVVLNGEATYLVGGQELAGQTGLGYAYNGSTPIDFTKPLDKNFAFAKVTGNGANFVYADGLFFGQFDPVTGDPAFNPTPFTDQDYRGRIGNLIRAQRCDKIVIDSFSADGNIRNAVLGGDWGDTGKQLRHTCLWLEKCANIDVGNVRSFDFGLDGCQVGWGGISEPDNASGKFSDCVFDQGGRQGVSVVGYKNLFFYRCKFTNTGKGSIASGPGAGVDLENENGIIENTFFYDCFFDNNNSAGLLTVGDIVNTRVFDSTLIGAPLFLSSGTSGFHLSRSYLNGCSESLRNASQAVFEDCEIVYDESNSGGTTLNVASYLLNNLENSKLVRCDVSVVTPDKTNGSFFNSTNVLLIDTSVTDQPSDSGSFFGGVESNGNCYFSTIRKPSAYGEPLYDASIATVLDATDPEDKDLANQTSGILNYAAQEIGRSGQVTIFRSDWAYLPQIKSFYGSSTNGSASTFTAWSARGYAPSDNQLGNYTADIRITDRPGTESFSNNRRGSDIEFWAGTEFGPTTSKIAVVSAEGSLDPGTDAGNSLGRSSKRWSEVFAATGSINTSDKDDKRDIGVIDNSLVNAFLSIQPSAFRFKDSVEQKGDEARVHMGYIAQELQSALIEEGVDPERYAIWCQDPIEELRNTGEVREYEDQDGVTRKSDVMEWYVVGHRQGIRYSHFIALMEAANRKRFSALEERINALESGGE